MKLIVVEVEATSCIARNTEEKIHSLSKWKPFLKILEITSLYNLICNNFMSYFVSPFTKTENYSDVNEFRNLNVIIFE